MANLYIFAIGGSGSRVLRSLTMLLASGVQTQSTVIPIIIDPDASNGDLNRTVPLLRSYKQLHDCLKFNSHIQSKFFSTELASLNNDGRYLLPLNGTTGISYESYLNIGTMSAQNQALTKMLFSNDNLSSDMNVGFKGNPNIGSVVLNQFTQSADFANFETNFVAGDKIFIISSIFGGTGASGFPLLLKTMRSSTNTALASAPIGAVSLLPYFNLKADATSAIQADSFITKTKAALNYYERNVTGNRSLHEMYYVGDDYSSAGYDNCEGGGNQQNDAHVVEMLAALSVIDFDSKSYSPGIPSNTIFNEFGLEGTPNGKIIFTDFGAVIRDIIVKPLSMMAIMNSYLNNNDKSHRTSQRWAKDRNELLGDKFYSSQFFRNYIQFTNSGNDGFEVWLKEMAGNSIGFDPFSSDADVRKDGLNKVKGYPPRYSSFKPFQKKGYELLDETMSKQLKELDSNLDAPTAFMELFYRSLSILCTEKLDMR